MKKIAVLFANGTEEIEALTPFDILKRAGADCEIISVSGENPVGSHGIKIIPDKTAEEISFSDYDAVVIPGGMPGAVNIAKNEKVVCGIKNLKNDGKLVAAICASPAVVLAENGILNGEKATCYPAPDFIENVKKHGVYVFEHTVTCENVITADGPKSAMEFSLSICKYLGITPKF